MKRFREAVSPTEQGHLFPPYLGDLIAPDDAVRLVSDVVESLDLSAFEAVYPGGGAPAYAPSMLVKVLLFACSEGLRSSRRIEQALKTDVRFMYLSGMQRPDYRTIARFRRGHEAGIRALFVEVVRLCEAMGLVLMRHVSVDGTKIEANVSGRETYGRDRLDKTLVSVEERIARILEEVEAADASEDEKEPSDGDGGNSGGLPEELRDATRRKERVQAAKRKLQETGHRAVPATDLDARVMRTTSGNRAAYNAQAVVDAEHQVIVAAEVTDACCDNAQLEPMIESAKGNTGTAPSVVTADCGYHSLDTLKYVHKTGLSAYIPVHGRKGTKRQEYVYDAIRDVYLTADGKELTYRKDIVMRKKTYRWYHAPRSGSQPFPELYVRADGEMQEAMTRKLSSPEGKAAYRLRKQIVEPVFGHLKTQYGLRKFLLRGRGGANVEYLLACIAHNIGKLRPVWMAEAHLVPA